MCKAFKHKASKCKAFNITKVMEIVRVYNNVNNIFDKYIDTKFACLEVLNEFNK